MCGYHGLRGGLPVDGDEAGDGVEATVVGEEGEGMLEAEGGDPEVVEAGGGDGEAEIAAEAAVDTSGCHVRDENGPPVHELFYFGEFLRRPFRRMRSSE